MHNLALAQEADNIVDIRIVGQAENIVIGRSGFLLSAHILGQVGDHIAFYRNGSRRPWGSGSKLRVNPCGVIDKIRFKSRFFDLLNRHIPRKLLHDGRHHLQMPEFFRADVRQKAPQFGIRHGVALGKIPQRGAEFTVRTAVLADDKFCQRGIGVFDLYRILQPFFIHKHFFALLTSDTATATDRKAS